MLKDTSLSVRKKIVVALGEIGYPEAIPSLCIALLEDKNINIREKAAEALGKIGDPKVADALSKALLNDKNRNVRRKSAEALGKIGNYSPGADNRKFDRAAKNQRQSDKRNGCQDSHGTNRQI